MLAAESLTKGHSTRAAGLHKRRETNFTMLELAIPRKTPEGTYALE
jgi:hypothetical protein